MAKELAPLASHSDYAKATSELRELERQHAELEKLIEQGDKWRDRADELATRVAAGQSVDGLDMKPIDSAELSRKKFVLARAVDLKKSEIALITARLTRDAVAAVVPNWKALVKARVLAQVNLANAYAQECGIHGLLERAGYSGAGLPMFDAPEVGNPLEFDNPQNRLIREAIREGIISEHDPLAKLIR